MTDYHMIPEK